MGARSEIENTLYRYAWTFDMDELSGIGECFTEDAEVEFSTGVQVGRANVVTELTRRRDKYRPTEAVPWHAITNVFIRRETDAEADVVSFFTYFVKTPGNPPEPRSLGHYADLFVPDGGTWRVKQRRVVNA